MNKTKYSVLLLHSQTICLLSQETLSINVQHRLCWYQKSQKKNCKRNSRFYSQMIISKQSSSHITIYSQLTIGNKTMYQNGTWLFSPSHFFLCSSAFVVLRRI